LANWKYLDSGIISTIEDEHEDITAHLGSHLNGLDEPKMDYETLVDDLLDDDPEWYPFESKAVSLVAVEICLTHRVIIHRCFTWI
jgi:hypothetical protein